MLLAPGPWIKQETSIECQGRWFDLCTRLGMEQVSIVAL